MYELINSLTDIGKVGRCAKTFVGDCRLWLDFDQVISIKKRHIDKYTLLSVLFPKIVPCENKIKQLSLYLPHFTFSKNCPM